MHDSPPPMVEQIKQLIGLLRQIADSEYDYIGDIVLVAIDPELWEVIGNYKTR